jgi:hypothetical protein
VVPKGPHLGKTMIPGPAATNVRVAVENVPVTDMDVVRAFAGQPYRSQSVAVVQAEGVGYSDCYLTDQRSFSNDIHAKSRMHSEFRLDFAQSAVKMTQWHNCDWTTECDCEDGTVECYKQGKTDRMTFRLKLGAGASASAPVVVEMTCSACNPCAPSSRWFGDIDYEGTITVDRTARTVLIDAKIDSFPAFEAYATINDGAGVPIFQMPPPAGNTVRNLPRGATRRVRYSLRDTSGNGVFNECRAL